MIIGSGMANVFTNNLPAAKAHIDLVSCDKHSGTPPIAMGSDNVLINNQPAARVDDQIACGAVITDGSPDVFIGGGTAQTDIVQPENLVPGWVHAALFVVGGAAAVVLGGHIVAAVGLAGGFAGGAGGSWIGGRLWGPGSDGQKWAMLGGSLLGGLFGVKSGGMLANRLVGTPTTAGQAFVKGGISEVDRFGLSPRLGNAEPRGARGIATSWEGFDEAKAGGPIRNLTTERIKITHRGVDVVENHVKRFGPDKANKMMVDRLRKIADGELEPAQQDRNFYSHELREFVRYRWLGWKNGVPGDADAAMDLWRQTHCASLEDYGLPLRSDALLYHPDTLPFLGD